MADIGRRRPLKLAHGLGLERQHRQNMIDIAAHARRAFRLPGPYARADIVDDRQIRQRVANATRDTMGEIRTIDDQQGIGARSNNGIRRLADAQNQLWQTREHLREAMIESSE